MSSPLRLVRSFGDDHEMNLTWVAKHIMLFSSHREIARSVLRNDGEDANEWMEAVQLWLDSVDDFHPMRRAAINLILLLAKRRNVCPPSLMVQSNSRLVVNPWIWRGGGLADIHAGTYDGQHVVLKRVRIVGQADEQKAMHIDARSEAIIWRQLHHPNILQFIGIDPNVWGEKKEIEMLSPRVAHTLHDFVRFEPGKDQSQEPQQGSLNPPSAMYDPTKHRVSLLTDIARAIHYLHSLELVHGDINTTNILVTNDVQALLADFGSTMHDRLSCDNGIPEGVLKGTPGWMSPERIHRERKLDWLGPETDIYSFGCVAYAICTGSPPWYNRSTHGADDKIRSGEMPPIPPDAGSLLCNGPVPSEFHRELIKKCWAFQPEDRPNIAAVLTYFDHPAASKLPLSAISIVRATHSYNPQPGSLDQLSFREGDVLHVYEKNGANWFARSNTGAFGFVHEAYFTTPSPHQDIPEVEAWSDVAHDSTYLHPETQGKGS